MSNLLQENDVLVWLSFKSPVTAPGHSQLHDLFEQQANLHAQLRRYAEQAAALTTAAKVG
jgi:myo-inositol-1-phosphate synthase